MAEVDKRVASVLAAVGSQVHEARADGRPGHAGDDGEVQAGAGGVAAVYEHGTVEHVAQLARRVLLGLALEVVDGGRRVAPADRLAVANETALACRQRRCTQ